MKNWKVLSIVFISYLLILPVYNTYACGWVDFTMYYNLFDPTLLLTDEYSPLFYTTPLYSNHWIHGSSAQDDNVAEWARFLLINSPDNNIHAMIYDTTLEELEAAYNGNYRGSNKLLHYLIKNNRKEVLHYILFAKQCEKYCNIRDYWDEKPSDNGEVELIELGKTGSTESKSRFIRLRYAFQTVKLLHHYDRLRECILLYDEVIAPSGEDSIIKYWALDHKAGALLKLNKRAEGLYLFSRVFAACPSRRYSSFYSFDVATQQEWEQCLAYCKNNDEKATLYFLRAMDPSSVALEEIKSIYRLNPAAEYLNLLTVREINKLENELLKDELKDNYIIIRKSGGTHNYHKLLNYLKELKDFVNMVIKEKPIQQKAFWQICSAYLDFLSYNLKTARSTLNSISTVNSSYRRQINIIHTAIAASGLNTIDKKAENEIMTMLLNAYPENIANREITRYVLDSMRALYTKKKPFTYYYTGIYDLRCNPDQATIQQLFDLASQTQHTLFEKFLLLRMNAYFSGEYVFSAEVLMNKTDYMELKNSLLEMKAMLLLLADEIQEAIAIYASLPEKMRSERRFIDPFTTSIHDIIWDDYYDGKLISRFEFAKKLLELKTSIKKNPQNAHAYYLLGNAYYNITYFGKSWDLVGYFRSGSYYSGFTDCSRALNYYKKAFELSKDRELKAECCFLMAKCRQNMFDLEYNTEDYGYGYGSDKWKRYIRENEYWKAEELKHDKGYREYFKILKGAYSDTDYYRKVIKGCKYFKFYASRF